MVVVSVEAVFVIVTVIGEKVSVGRAADDGVIANPLVDATAAERRKRVLVMDMID